MNEKKIIIHLMMEIINSAQEGIKFLDSNKDGYETVVRICFKNIEDYARMIIED